MEKRQQLYEGKAKKVFATDDPELLIVSYKDDATAFNGVKRGTIAGKGVINNRMSNRLMRMLENAGIPTHLVRELSDRDTLVRRVEIVPLEVKSSAYKTHVSMDEFCKKYSSRIANDRYLVYTKDYLKDGNIKYLPAYLAYFIK